MNIKVSKVTGVIILMLLLLHTNYFSTYGQKKIILNNFKSDFIFYDGLLAVENSETKKWGFIDTSGNIVIPFQWERTADIWLGLKNPKFGGGACALYKMVGRAKRWYIVDKKGGQIPLPATTIVVSNFNKDGYAIAIKQTGDKSKNKRVYINTKGVEVFPSLVSLEYGKELRVDSPPAFYDGIALFGSYQKYGYIDRQGRIIVKPVLVQAKDFSDGLAAVMVPATSTSASRWGYINTKGEFAISPQFSKEVESFSNGFALVKKTNGSLIFIDKAGDARTKDLKDATSFFNGYAWIKPSENGGSYVIDTNFDTVQESPHFYTGYSTNIEQRHGRFILRQRGHNYNNKNLLDALGNEIDLWNICKICSDNIVLQEKESYDAPTRFINVDKKEYIFTIEKSEF